MAIFDGVSVELDHLSQIEFNRRKNIEQDKRIASNAFNIQELINNAPTEELEQIATNTNNINALETNKADKATTLSGYGITDAYTKTEIESKIASVYKYKGSVDNYASLPTTDLTIGDVYNVEDTGDNYAWTGTEWDKLAGTIDLSNYATKLSIGQWHVPYRDIAGNGEPNTSKLATMTSPLPEAILIRDAEGKATFVGGTSSNQGIVKSQLDSALANRVTTNTEQTISGEKTFTSNIIGNLTGNSSSSTFCSRLKGTDTRDDNQPPEWYYINQVINARTFLSEFKTSSAIGLSSSLYCLLLTIVPWSDPTGGLPSQTAYMSNGDIFKRAATNATTWGAWNKLATTNDLDGYEPSFQVLPVSKGGTGASSQIALGLNVENVKLLGKGSAGTFQYDVECETSVSGDPKKIPSSKAIRDYVDAQISTAIQSSWGGEY